MSDPSSLLAPWLVDLKPYAVENTDGMVKLDAMENPYVFPESLQVAWLECLQQAEINRYPDPNCTALKEALRKQLNLPQSASLLLGNGSDEIIHMLCLAFNRPGALMMSPSPSFAVYPLAAKAVNMKFKGVPLDENTFELSVEHFVEAINEEQPALIFIASPNNPTGNRFRVDDIKKICAASSGLVVLDEAYWRFAKSNCIDALFDLQNIVFMHTLSKIGLAGIRLGALIGQAQWLEPLERVRMPYNIGSLTQATACFAIEHDEHFAAQVDSICASRQKLQTQLQQLSAVHVWPSETNFLLFRVASNGSEIHRRLREKNIAIKNLDGGHAALKNCLRVSIGTDAENELFIQALKDALG